MNITIKIAKYFVFLGTNYFLLFFSNDIDIEQFQKDVYIFFEEDFFQDNTIFIFISNFVVLSTFIIKQILKPFVEIFIEHYYKYGFYFLINILSISATFIVLRVYGYSRFYLLIYLLFSSLVFEIFDRIERKINS